MNLRIHNVRFGRATNSSSSHSVIFLPGVTDNPPESYFGRAAFTLASEEWKRRYFRAQIGQPEDPDDHVDHRSMWRLAGASPEFLRELERLLLTDGVVVLGGNDNGDGHPLAGSGRSLDDFFRQFTDESHVRIRTDPLGYHAIFTMRWRGAVKLRMKFEETDSVSVAPYRATWPELVDLKITDRCARGCAYCYQGSTPNGRHAPFDRIVAILDMLAAAKVFEVVLGGGEPLFHPDIDRIVQAARERGLAVGVTTRQPLKSRPEAWRGVAVALSVDASKDIGSTDKPDAIHVVMGSEASTRKNLASILKACEEKWLRPVLLGWKPVGRAAGIKPVDYGHWIDTVEASGIGLVSIDTTLAAEYAPELAKRGVPKWLMDFEDGRFSMYIDAVEGTYGPSSYEGEHRMRSLGELTEPGLRQMFQAINEDLDAARLRRQLAVDAAVAQRAGDADSQVRLDAALEGRCEVCGKRGERVDRLDRPKFFCKEHR